MKKVYIFLFTLVFIQFNNLFSENWEPFPLNQTSYYKITEAKPLYLINFESKDLIDAITIIKFDSIANQNSNNKKYFSQILINNDSCLFSKKDSLWDKYDRFSNLQPESYLFIDDTLVFQVKDEQNITNTCLKLPLNLEIGASYLQSNFDNNYNYTIKIETKLISKTEKSFFGIKDSVITFQIQRSRLPEKDDGTFIIELSKEFGLIKFFPLDVLFPWSLVTEIQQLELVAVDANQEHYGEVYDFQYRKRDYLENSGNIKIYKYLWGGYPWDFMCIRDSIISVDNSDDAVYVVYNHQTMSTNQGVFPDINKIYTYNYFKKDSLIYYGFNAMVDALRRGETFIPSTKLYDKIPNEATMQKDDSLEIIATPLLFKFIDKCGHKDLQIFYFYQAALDRENCSIPLWFLSYRILDYKMDLWWDHYWNFEVHEGNHYVGFKDGDCEWGDLTWPPKGLSVSQHLQNINMIFPNPAQDVLNLTNIPDGAIDFEIINQYGVPQLKGFVSEQIDVSQLPAGIYFLKLNSQTTPIKFIKL